MTEVYIKPKNPKVQDLTGKRFNRLTVIRYFGSKDGNATWLCLCDCGTIKSIAGSALRGKTKSCGCLWRENLTKPKHKKHGHMTGGIATLTYSSWASMFSRCSDNPKRDKYKYYAARGITICERWTDFNNFMTDMGERPSRNHTIERIDNNGNYEPSNCKWATKGEQARNTSRNITLSFDGKSMVVSEWARFLGIEQSTIFNRYHRGFPIEKVLSTINLQTLKSLNKNS